MSGGATWSVYDTAGCESVRGSALTAPSWEVIGGALGVSRQAAHERYAGPDLD